MRNIMGSNVHNILSFIKVTRRVEDEESQCWSILSIRPRHFVHIVGPIGLLVQNTLKTILVVDFLWFKVYGSWWNLCRERILSIYPTERITKTVGERGVSVRLIILLNHGHGHSWWWDEDEMLVIFILSSLVHNLSPTLMKYRIFYETH